LGDKTELGQKTNPEISNTGGWMKYEVTFACGEKGCSASVTVQVEALPGETPEQLKRRNPDVGIQTCRQGHTGFYRLSAAREIVKAP
jgi:hypothetical protein